MYFLDTNTCIYFLNGKYESIKRKILALPPGKIAIPCVVKAELLFGAFKSRKKRENLEKIEKFLEPFEITSFDDPTTYAYAEIRETVETKGNVVGPNDMMIAAIVKCHDGTLVTNNIREFERIRGLKLENWIEV